MIALFLKKKALLTPSTLLASYSKNFVHMILTQYFQINDFATFTTRSKKRQTKTSVYRFKYLNKCKKKINNVLLFKLIHNCTKLKFGSCYIITPSPTSKTNRLFWIKCSKIHHMILIIFIWKALQFNISASIIYI